jgi:hypothetical protein
VPRRVVAFVALTVVCVLTVAGIGVSSILKAKADTRAGERAAAAAAPKLDTVLAGDTPFAVFRHVDRAHPERYGRLSVAALDSDGPGAPLPLGMTCQRVGYAAGAGLCLDVLGTEMGVTVLDTRLRERSSFTLTGIPSRARISPDGRWGGVTAFVVGHAYASPGQFSTAATIIDLRAGKPLADLEKDFTVTRDGKVVDATDRNFWGLTFAGDGDTFYATLATGGKTWLIKGSIRERRAQTIHENVECPSLSPDGTRIGYKKAVSYNPSTWRFHVLDLATGRETALAETRNIDDQLAWLDDERLLYGFEDRTWVVAADGSGRPRTWLGASDSATVGRTTGSHLE